MMMNGLAVMSNVTKTHHLKADESGTSGHAQQTVSYDDYKVFNDPVHGHIPLHPLLVKIIDTPQFQRLRNIKQLGGKYFVYPGASHNRFEHSIGVAYLAEKLVRTLQQRQKELNITEKDILCVAIAGLCHDLGHGPFSHLFDGMFLPQVLPDRKWKHEDGSCKMLDHLIEENELKQEFEKHCLTDDDVIFIKEMIAGPQSGKNDEKEVGTPSKKAGGEWRYKGRDSTKSFLYEIVSNERNKMDVDKWDYFARDCHHLGIRNSFDHNRFMQFMKVLKSEDGQLQLCARDKELVNLYEMFHTRSILHQRAYQHKTSIAIELMITKALVKANKHIKTSGTGGRLCSISECIDDLVAYTKLNDSIFYRILYSDLDNPDMDEARQLLDRVHKRHLFVCIGAVSCYTNETGVTAQDIICLDSTLQDGDIIVWKTKIDHGKGEDNPVKNFSFFRKSDKDQASLIPEMEISKVLLPQQFQDKSCLVWCTSEDSDKIATAKMCWKKWKKYNPKRTTLDTTWTPMRKRFRSSGGNDETSKAKKKLILRQSPEPGLKRLESNPSRDSFSH